MRKEILNTATTQGNAHAEPMSMLKRVGSSTYLVSVHSGRTSHKVIEDRILRLIKQEVGNIA